MTQFSDSAALSAEYERIDALTGALHKAMTGVRITMDSADGLVTVVTDGRGEVLELELDPRVYQARDSRALADTILGTIRAAYEKATDESLRELEKTSDRADKHLRPVLDRVRDTWGPDQDRR
jgi:DNA-binding protein YbaB